MFALNLMFEDSQLSGCPLNAERMNSLCSEVLQQQSLVPLDGVDCVEFSVQLLDTDAMQSLNSQYRQRDAATNVLSFESSMPVLKDEQGQMHRALGDLVFCPKVIASEAAEQVKSIDEHWVHMLVHGTLHLCGYDHVDSADAETMENLEIHILSSLGVPDPYQNRPVS